MMRGADAWALVRIGASLSTVLLAAPVRAQMAPVAALPAATPPAFGDRGQVVVTSAFDFAVDYFGEAGSSMLDFDIAPSAHYFILPGLSVGLGFTVRQAPYVVSTPRTAIIGHETTLGVGAIVGYNVPLGRFASLWMRGEFSYADEKYPKTTAASAALGNDNHDVTLEFFAPFLVHPAPHFFIGFGPYVWGDLIDERGSDDHRRFSVGAGSTLGGWF